MVKKYLVAFAMTAIATGWAYGCSSDDTATPTEAGTEDVKVKKDVGEIEEPDAGPTCTPGDVSGFTAAATKGVIAPHQGKCTAEQLASFVKCLDDFSANEADCKAWGFDPKKPVSTAITGDCGTCLFAAPTKPGTALKLEVIGGKPYLGLNEVACTEAFAGAECGKQAQAVNDCATEACGEAQGCTETAAIQKCMQTAIGKGCSKFTEAAVACVDGTNEADADGGKVLIGDSGSTIHPAVDICGQFNAYTGDATPPEVTYAWGNYLCGK